MGHSLKIVQFAALVQNSIFRVTVEEIAAMHKFDDTGICNYCVYTSLLNGLAVLDHRDAYSKAHAPSAPNCAYAAFSGTLGVRVANRLHQLYGHEWTIRYLRANKAERAELAKAFPPAFVSYRYSLEKYVQSQLDKLFTVYTHVMHDAYQEFYAPSTLDSHDAHEWLVSYYKRGVYNMRDGYGGTVKRRVQYSDNAPFLTLVTVTDNTSDNA